MNIDREFRGLDHHSGQAVFRDGVRFAPTASREGFGVAAMVRNWFDSRIVNLRCFFNPLHPFLAMGRCLVRATRPFPGARECLPPFEKAGWGGSVTFAGPANLLKSPLTPLC
jgi:hypothetical protein